jgi:DNA-directed RNA polymerase subunit RPC12/RpoP
MPVSTDFACSQCGGELHPDEGQIFLTCPYCSATVYLDKSRVVFHWYVAPTLKDQDAVGALYRWMSGSQTVKDLDKKARLVGQSFQYFPVWYFKWQNRGKEEIALQPAAATSVSELANLKIPAGDLRKYDSGLDAQSAAPTVPLDAGLEWVKQKNPGTALAMKEMSIVHIPLYFYKYAFRDQTYTAVVDAASGTVLANLFPAKEEAHYLLVGIVTALVYLCLALVPMMTWGSSGNTDGTTGLMICGGLGLVAAPILFAWAYWVASRI